MDTTPGPAPVCRALKNSPHQLINTMMSCPTRRISQRVQPWELDCLLHDGTRGTRWTRTPGTSITMSMRSRATTGMSTTSAGKGPTNSLDHGTASAARRGDERPVEPHDLHNRDINDLVQQLGNFYGL